ncbi:MAG: hypothetical protein IPJ68_00025 [Candidatus Moraniibacteriota bacterium]|nr:MAG: hypothetical protein IPJ68_00025 [Candidatus Moranbacteria bacterium]
MSGATHIAYLSYQRSGGSARNLELAVPRQAIKPTALLRHSVYTNSSSGNRKR